MTTIAYKRYALQFPTHARLLILLGKMNVDLLKKLLISFPEPFPAHAVFAHIFEGGSLHTNLYEHITSLEFGQETEVEIGINGSIVTPCAAILGISLDEYKRLRKAKESGAQTFYPFEEMPSDLLHNR